VLFAMGPAAAGMYPLSLPDALPIFAVWTLYAGMRALLLLPYELQLAVGKRFGRVAWHAMRKRRRIADRNIEICMPELSAEERAALVKRHFEALGASLIETTMGWFGPVDEIKRRVTIRGEEHLRAALERGRGVVLYSAHFTSLEFNFAALRPLCPRITG